METTPKQFNLIIAYLIPGFIGLAGLVPLIPAVGNWLQPVAQGDLGFGPPIYALLAAVAIGQIVSCFRWVLLDQLHHLTGLRAPDINFARFADRIDGFDFLIQNHFRYYEFSGNTLIAVLWTYGVNRILQTSPFLDFGTDLGMAVLAAVLFVASRDAITKYYLRSRQLFGEVAEKGPTGDPMYNGCDHAKEGGSPPKPDTKAKPATESAAQKQPDSGKEKTPQSGK